MAKVRDLRVVFYPRKNGQYFMTALAIRGINTISSYADCVQIDCWDVCSNNKNELVVHVEIETDLNFYLIRALTLDKTSR